MRDLFLRGAASVLAAVSDPRVAGAWEAPSVLRDQTIGDLASHLGRVAVLAVEEYLDRPVDDTAVQIKDPAAWFVAGARHMTESGHEAMRSRSSELAADGNDVLVERLRASISNLRERLLNEPEIRPVAVFGGATMDLDDYLVTRIVEQVVHLDDLARSLPCDPWPMPSEADLLVLQCGLEIGRRRRGNQAMLRALFRDDAATALPVI